MKRHEKILNEFITKYTGLPGIKGIFWGGSSSGHAPDMYSDIDLFVVTDDNVQRKHGLRQMYGIDVEYFVNPLKRIYHQMDMEIKEVHDYWVIKIYAFSKIMYDPENEADRLQKKALEMFELPFSEINYNRDLQNYFQAYDAYQKFQGLFQLHLQWRVMYYECMKALLNAHCYHNKLPLIPWSKSQRLIIDPKYRQVYHLKKIPESEFCTLFIRCFENKEERIMQRRLNELFKYCIKKSNFNPGNFTIIK